MAQKELKPQDRMCWFCQYFVFRNGEPGYGEYTPRSDFYIECAKHHWEFDSYGNSQAHFGNCLSKAKECTDFIQITI